MAPPARRPYDRSVDRAAHQAWLKELAAEDRLRRHAAEPELQRKEAALAMARGRLAETEVALAELELALEEASREADEPRSG